MSLLYAENQFKTFVNLSKRQNNNMKITSMILVALPVVTLCENLSGESSVYLVDRESTSSDYKLRLIYNDYLTDKTSVIIGCRTVSGCVIILEPLGTLFVVYSDDTPCKFKVKSSRSYVYPSGCSVPSISGDHQYYWISWNRDTKDMEIGQGVYTGSNLLGSGNYGSGEIKDLYLRPGSLTTSSFGFTEFLIYPNSQIMALNRQESRIGQGQFYHRIAGAQSVVFGIRGENVASLYIYKKDAASPVFRIKFTEGSNNIRVYTTESTSEYTDVTLNEIATPGLEDDKKFYWMTCDTESKSVRLGEGTIIGEDVLMTEADSYIHTGVEFDSIMIDHEVATAAALEVTLINPPKKTPDVIINEQKSTIDEASLNIMVDSYNDTCLTLTPDLSCTDMATDCTNTFRMEFDMMLTAEELAVDVFSPNTKCQDFMVLMDFRDETESTEAFVGRFKICDMDSLSVDNEMCRYICDGGTDMKKIILFHVRVGYEIQELRVCDVLIKSI